MAQTLPPTMPAPAPKIPVNGHLTNGIKSGSTEGLQIIDDEKRFTFVSSFKQIEAMALIYQ